MDINSTFRALFKLSLFLYLVLVFVQIPLLSTDLQAYYLFLILMPIFGIAYLKQAFIIVLTEKTLFGLLYVLLLSFIYAWYALGFQVDSIRFFILLLSLFSGVMAYFLISEDTLAKFINTIAVLVILVVIFRLMLYFEELIVLINDGRKFLGESYPYLTSGGHNIEVTYLLILSALIKNRFLFIGVFGVAFLYSILYESRVGILISILLLLYRNNLIRLSATNIMIGIVGFSILVAILVFSDLGVFNRFLDVQKELDYGAEGVGRIGFYLGSYEMISQGHILAGVGNAVLAMESVTGMDYKENNVHNIYLQYLLDSSLIGALLLLLFAVKMLNQALKEQANFFPGFVVLTFFTIGLLQYTGYDSINWFFVGYFLSFLYLKRIAAQS